MAREELIAIAARFGAISVGYSSGIEEVPRRWLGRLLGYPRVYVTVHLLSLHALEAKDTSERAQKFSAEIRAWTADKPMTRVDWRISPLVKLDPRAAKAVKLLPK